MASPQCPLGRQAFLNSKKPMGLHHVQQIEEHVAACSPDCPHPPLKDIVFNDPIKGSSPLLMACYYGDLDSVERIVEHWKVDVNLAATYYIDPFNDELLSRKIEKAAPLFVAAANGHADVVYYLVEKGANVSAKTSDQDDPLYDGLTPLYGTGSDDDCYLPNFKILGREREERSNIISYLLESGADSSMENISRPSDGKPIWMSTYWCGIEAITALIDCGMDLNHQPPNGLTILSHWAGRSFHSTEEESLAVIQLLIERGGDPNSTEASGFSPITKAAHRQNWVIFDFLLERNDVSRREKIVALELAGAVILSNTKHAHLFSKAFGYWRRSLLLRLEDTDGCGPIVKTSPKNLETGGVIEWTTSEELENVIQHRIEQELQSFLVQSRILCAIKNWDAVQYLFSNYIGGYPSEILSQLEEQRRFADHLNIVWSMLEIVGRFDPREEDRWLVRLKISNSLNQLLTTLGESNDPFLGAKIIETSLELMLATDQFHMNDRKSFDISEDWHIHCYMYSIFSLIRMLADLPELVNENSLESLSGLVSRDHHRHPKRGSSLLHMACEYLYSSNGLATIDLLLRAGADPNAGERNGNGPLHVLVELDEDNETMDAAARLLLEKGSHLDRVNDEGKTAADVWTEKHAHIGGRKRRRSGEQEAEPKSCLPSWLRPDDPVPKLKCQCAKVIRSNGVPYKQKLPPSLHPFVSWH